MRRESRDSVVARNPTNESRYGAEECKFTGCRNKTREQKPYCPDHVEQHAYVQGIIRHLEEREAQDLRTVRRGNVGVDLNAHTIDEIVLHLRLNGDRTIERLTRETLGQQNYPNPQRIMEAYIDAMERAGIVTLGRTRRGATLVCLTTSNEGVA